MNSAYNNWPDYGVRPIHCLLKSETEVNLECIKMLAKYGADLDAVTSCGTSALLLAVQKQKVILDVIKFFVECGCDIFRIDNFGQYLISVLFRHAMFDLQWMQFLEECKVEFKNLSINNIHKTQNCFHDYASGMSKFDIEIIKLMKEQGVELKEKDTSGRTGSHIIFTKKELTVESARFLSEIGSATEEDFLYATCMNPNPRLEIIKFLVEQAGVEVNCTFNKDTPLHALCCNCGSSEDVIRHLIEKGASVNFREESGNSSLYKLCIVHKKCSLELLKLFFEKGHDVSIEIKTDCDKRLFREAIQCKEIKFEKLKYLADKGLRFEDISHCCLYRGLEEVKFFLERVDKVDWDKCLQLACESAYPSAEVISHLLERGANVNCEQFAKMQSTPLHTLVRDSNWNTKSVITLIENGANMNKMNGNKKTAFHCFLISAKSSRNTLLAILSHCYVDLSFAKENNQTVFEVAESEKKFGYLQILKDYEEKGTIWTPERHKHFPTVAKKSIETLILINKFRVSPILKVPRPLLHRICSTSTLLPPFPKLNWLFRT